MFKLKPVNIKSIFSGKKKLLTIPVAILIGLAFFPITIGLFLIWISYRKVKNKKLKYLATSFLALLTLLFGGTWVSALVSPTPPKTQTEKVQPTRSPEETPSTTSESEPTPADNNPAQNEPNTNTIKVTRVVDGDTIEIEGGRKVRLIGIDTPETVDPNRPVGCYGVEASNFTKSKLQGKEVSLEKDVSETDKYGRLLRYVWLNGENFNETLVKEGYAQVSTYPPDVKYQSVFLAAQTEAKNNNRGLWGVCSSPNSKVTQPSTAPTPVPVTNSGSSQCKYSCSGPDKDCSDFSTHAEAQAFFNCCGFTATYDPMRLDRANGVGNGIACESLP